MLHSHTNRQHFRITFSELQSTDQLRNYLLASQEGHCFMELYTSSEKSNMSVNFYSVGFLVYCVTWLLNRSWIIFVIVPHDVVMKWRMLITAKTFQCLDLNKASNQTDSSKCHVTSNTRYFHHIPITLLPVMTKTYLCCITYLGIIKIYLFMIPPHLSLPQKLEPFFDFVFPV
jgi:hypothetical protein